MERNITVSVRSFFEQTYLPRQLTGCAAETKVQYRNAIGHLERYADAEVSVQNLCDDLVARLLAWLVDERGLSKATANKVRRHLLAVWRLAWRDDLLPRLPKVRRLREPKRIPVAWLEEELARIMRIAGEMPGEVCAIPAGRWWQALLLLLYYSGLRISALMKLEWKYLDEAGRLLVPAELQKQDADQLFELPAECTETLERIRGQWRWIFPWPYDRWGPQWPTLNRRLKGILAKAGLSNGRKDLFHKIRRSCASYLKAAGGDPCSQLGHSSEQVTRGYLDPRICRPQRQADLLPRLRY